MASLAALFLTFAGCGLLYQADARRSAFAGLKTSWRARYLVRGCAVGVCMLALCLAAAPQGWERGVPIWVGLLSLCFVAGLYLAARRPAWHGPATGAALAGGFAFVGGVLL